MVIPGYTVHGQLGKGGMATVYLATQESLGRKVAIKVLHDFKETHANQRFINEARLIASIAHPRVITIYDVASLENGDYYIVMEFLSGGDLTQRQAELHSPDDALRIIKQIAEGLEIIHAKGIIHRDIKPANVLFREDGSAVLTDFGIAKDLAEDADLTQAGVSVGSPSYSSPEQAQCQPIDRRTDIYSLGVIFLELLLGSNPFKGDSHTETFMNHIQMPLPELPGDLSIYKPLIDRMSAKQADDRFADSAALLAAIDQVLNSQHTQLHAAIKPVSTAQRTASTNGDDDQTLVASQSAVVSRRKPLTPYLVALLVAIGAGLTAAYVRYYPGEQAQPIETGIEIYLAQAEKRLAEGKLTGPSNDNAEYLFQQALRIDPNNAVALAGLQEIEKQQAELVERQAAQWVETGYDRMEKKQLLVPEDDNAVLYFNKALALIPDYAPAREGLHHAAEAYVTLAKAAVDGKEYRKGILYVERGLSIEPDNPTLLALDEEYKKYSTPFKRMLNRVFGD